LVNINIKNLNARWLCLKLIENDQLLIKAISDYLAYDIINDEIIKEKLIYIHQQFETRNITKNILMDTVVSNIVTTAENICRDTVLFEKSDYNSTDRKIDKLLTSKLTGIPIMLILLMGIFWLTITGANYPSQLISSGLFFIEGQLLILFEKLAIPLWITEMLVYGVYRVVAWIVSVMLPPMAIFFPLFTLLEDLGYLPRVAFNLDKQFKKACACGKQALSMCMGFGCNAAGVTGCRIIDSPRERLIAIVTNNFVPCNGRFPSIIAIISMFFVGVAATPFNSLFSSLILTAVILLGIIMTFLVSRLLSSTILKGVPSSFTLELPPYRKPQILKTIVHSIFDRTLFVLGRALVVAAPAGLLIWLMANVYIDGTSILNITSGYLDPFAKLLGLDGVILLAFILGFPANEIVVPIIIMAYMSTGYITQLDSFVELKQLLVNHGWTWLTAVCTILFSLMHWPCSTTCLTIKKETQSIKWTVVSFLVPTVIGMSVCFIVASFVRIFGVL
jgi:ferrous iron transport protein B